MPCVTVGEHSNHGATSRSIYHRATSCHCVCCIVLRVLFRPKFQVGDVLRELRNSRFGYYMSRWAKHSNHWATSCHCVCCIVLRVLFLTISPRFQVGDVLRELRNSRFGCHMSRWANTLTTGLRHVIVCAVLSFVFYFVPFRPGSKSETFFESCGIADLVVTVGEHSNHRTTSCHCVCCIVLCVLFLTISSRFQVGDVLRELRNSRFGCHGGRTL